MHKWSAYSLSSDTIGVYEEIYEDLFIFDAHAHMGIDIDGSRMSVEKLARAMKRANVVRSIIFPLNDPVHYKNFTKPNDAVLEAYKRHPSNFVPFFRLNPNFNWENEFERCLSLGFKGIKLHPRSQEFDINSEGALQIYKMAEREKLPILMHLGIGMEDENVAKKLAAIAKNFPRLRLILGHGAFADLDSVVHRLGKNNNVLFEVSTMQVFDLFTLMSKISEKKIVFGSDIPYYSIDISLEAIIDTAVLLNKKPSRIQDMLGKNLLRWF